MTERLKKGDKVTHEDGESWPGEYTLVDDAVNSTVEVRSRDGHSFYFTVSRLTKVEESKPAVEVGDRILVTSAVAVVYNGDPAIPATVNRIGDGAQSGRVYVSTDKKVRGLTGFWADAWSVLVEEPPKVGDKVRVVYEGTVAYADAGSHITVELENGGRKALPKNRVEVLERAPKAYPVGTAVRYKTPGVAYPLLRDCDGWRNHGGELASSVTDARVRAGEFEVLYEPPQSA